VDLENPNNPKGKKPKVIMQYEDVESTNPKVPAVVTESIPKKI
jgi:hypothetical protein